MKRFLIPFAIVVVLLLGLAFLTEGSVLSTIQYRVF
jgi:hypothetical protein